MASIEVETLCFGVGHVKRIHFGYFLPVIIHRCSPIIDNFQIRGGSLASKSLKCDPSFDADLSFKAGTVSGPSCRQTSKDDGWTKHWGRIHIGVICKGVTGPVKREEIITDRQTNDKRAK